jgi:hypothetical protein
MAQAGPLVDSGVIRRDQPVMFGKSCQRDLQYDLAGA